MQAIARESVAPRPQRLRKGGKSVSRLFVSDGALVGIAHEFIPLMKTK